MYLLHFYINIEDNDESRSCTVFSNQKKIDEKIRELQHRIHGQKFKPDQDKDSIAIRYCEIQKRENDGDIDEEK